MSALIEDLADILKRRQIKSIQYFHCDHFEPWSRTLSARTAKGVERFAEMSQASPYGRRMSLFYSSYVPYGLDSAGASTANRRAGTDRVVFYPRSTEQEELARTVIRPLFGPNGHEPHLHVHHEFWTRNDSHFDTDVSRWVNAESTAGMDRDRLDLVFRLAKEVISREIGQPFDRWSFVHGNWALAASDPLICTIENELEMIMRHGGWGDFSFPAGRAYCDPELEVPFTCLPIEGKRPYDDQASDPRPVGMGQHGLLPGRFFIWNSAIKATYSSLDYYSDNNRQLFRDPTRILSEWLENSVSFGSDLYLKTHAHSMKWEYDICQDGTLIPHCFPDVVAIFEELMRVCDVAEVEFNLVTVEEVIQQLAAHDRQASPGERHGQTPNSHAISVAVSPSRPAAESLLAAADAPQASYVPRPAITDSVLGREPFAVPTRSDRSAGSQSRGANSLLRANGVPHATEKQATMSVDFRSFNGEFLKLQQIWMAGQGAQYGADELYASKLKRGVALESHELAVAEAVARRFERGTEIVEIGSGYGALSLFLAHHGFAVRSFEGDGRRFAATSWHFEQYRGHHAELVEQVDVTSGYYPDAPDRGAHSRVRKRVGLATNITCTYTATHQKAILEALSSRCDEVILDLGRFGVNRNSQEERDALRETMAGGHFEAVERIHSAPPYEYWLFRVVPATRATIPAPEDRAAVQAPSNDAVFPLGSPTSGTLYSVYGDRTIEACPVCHGHNTVHLWRMPMTSIKEPISLFGGYFNQVPTLQVPATIYCFDFCKDCESIYLNPAPAAQKAQYRKTDHYIRTMQAESLWREYENVFDQFAKWIPADATSMIDAACGIGPYLEVARKREPGRWSRLIGLELSEKYVEYMRTRGLEAHAFDIDNDDLVELIGRDTVDFLVFSEAFEHVERPLDALAKLLSVLRPGGRLYFTAQRYGRDVQAAVRPGEPIYIGEKVIKELPDRLGCRVVDVRTSGMRYFVVLEK